MALVNSGEPGTRALRLVVEVPLAPRVVLLPRALHPVVEVSLLVVRVHPALLKAVAHREVVHPVVGVPLVAHGARHQAVKVALLK